jgi:exonuclease VII large subunit
MCTGIRDLSLAIIEKNRTRVESSGIKLVQQTRIMISDIKDRVSGKIIEIINLGKEYTFRAGLIPANHLTRLISEVRSYSNIRKSALARTCTSLKVQTLVSLERIRVKIEGLENSLKIMNPENVLRRGYTITSFHGKIIKECELLKTDDIIDTQFSNGNVKSRILEKKKR